MQISEHRTTPALDEPTAVLFAPHPSWIARQTTARAEALRDEPGARTPVELQRRRRPAHVKRGGVSRNWRWPTRIAWVSVDDRSGAGRRRAWRFLDPAAKQVHPDWDEATALAVGGLRALFAEDPDDARLRALIDELSSSNERFTQFWEQAEVGYTKWITHLRHPEVGDLYLTRTKLDLLNTGGAQIITWHAPPNSTSAHALDQLRESLPKNSVRDR